MATTLSANFALPIAALILGAVVMLQWADWRALAGRPLSWSERQERMIAGLRRALRDDENRRNPKRWARTQVLLGQMLAELGTKMQDRVSVEAAIVAYRHALSVLSPDEDWIKRRPRGKVLGALSMITPRGSRTIRWAQAQQGLGFSLGYLGTLTDRLQLLDDAIDAYRAALTLFVREQDPANWANTQNRVGVTLSCLASRGRPGAGDEAVAIHKELLESVAKDGASAAANQAWSNYGSALTAKSEFGDGSAALREATAIFRKVVEQTPREQDPGHWAYIRCQLGDALRRLGQQTDNANALEEALVIQRAELELKGAMAPAAGRAATIDEIGAALRELGRLRDDPSLVREAVTCFRTALAGLSPDDQPLNWAEVQDNLATALTLLVAYEGEGDLLPDAEAAVRGALGIRTQDRFPLLWAISTDTLGSVLRARALSERRPDLALEAVGAHRAAIEVFDVSDARYRLRAAKGRLENANAAVAALASNG